MADFSGDPEQLRTYTRFIEEIKMALRAANREIIGKQIPELNKESFFRLAVSAAKLRADYLKAVLGMDWEDAGLDITAVRDKRAVYEEASKAFEALERTIERGYVDITEDTGS
jgi:membrane protease subunit (stomatin/prohibitin family)